MPRINAIAPAVAHLVGPGKLQVVNSRLEFSIPDQPRLQLDPAKLRELFCYGAVSVSDEALRVLCQREIAVAWLSASGSACRGRLVTARDSSTRLRMAQHRALAIEERQREFARGIVLAKFDSQLAAVRHLQRHGQHAAGAVLVQLNTGRTRAAAVGDLNGLRGLEGAAAVAWFGLLAASLAPPWVMNGRTRRPPRDPVNALLSLGYTWLCQRTVARVQAFGLEVQLGGLHEYQLGRPSLACDLMEPLRVPMVDRWVLRICAEGPWQPDQFEQSAAGVRLPQGQFGRVLANWDTHWQRSDGEGALDRLVRGACEWFREASGLREPVAQPPDNEEVE